MPSIKIEIDHQIVSEQVRLLYQHAAFVLVANIVVSSLSVAVFWDNAERVELLGWFFAILLLCGIRALMIRGYRCSETKGNSSTQFWARLFTLGSLLSGCLWGVAGAVFFFPSSPMDITFICIVEMGMVAGSVASLSSYPIAYYVFALPAIIPLVTRFFLQAEHGLAELGWMSVMFLAVNLGYSRNMARTIYQSISLRFENQSLLKKLHIEKERAEKANVAKSKFLAAASHDLRQPLHAQVFFLSALERQVQEPEAQKLLEGIRSTSEGLETLLNGLLDISKLDAGAILPQKTAFPINPLLNRIAAEFARQASQNDLEIRVIRSSLWLDSDPFMLERVLRNLLSNALRYTQQGRVSLGIRRTANGARIEVWDTGPGIPPESLELIFEEFHQLHNPERDRTKGLGLGLAIVKRLTTLLKHPLNVYSIVNRGSVFSVLVPIAPPLQLESPQVSAKTHQTDLLAQTLILVIDDEENIREGMAVVIEGWKAKAITAESAQEALFLLQESNRVPDIIVADYRLRDGATGEEEIKQVLKTLKQDIPACIITGDTAPDRIKEAKDSGFYLLHKPVSPAKLRALLSVLIKQKSTDNI